MELGVHQLGLVFFAWGLLVAAFSVWVAPRLQARFGTAPTMYAVFAALAVLLGVIAAGIDHPAVVIAATIASGAFIGINNTLMTQAVMLVSPVERPVASSSYGFLRFIGGGLAPFVAGQLTAASGGFALAFWVGAGALVVAIAILATGHRMLASAEAAAPAAHGDTPEQALAVPEPAGEGLDLDRLAQEAPTARR
nr:MFS transporter [Quadrisphaera sp. INWT6]